MAVPHPHHRCNCVRHKEINTIEEDPMNTKDVKQILKMLAPTMAILTLSVGLVWRNQEEVLAFIAFACDRQAVIATLEKMGAIGPLVFVGLVGLQVLIPSLPSEPPMIAGAYVYGFVKGFLISWLVTVAVTQSVFTMARRTGRPLVERFVPAKTLDKWTRIASKKGTLFFLLAFVIPPVPSDIMVYVAGLSAIDQRRFFVANLFGRLPLIALFSLVGANSFSNMPLLILGLIVFGVIMLIAWWYFIVRERPGAVKASA
jgi:uncharacterized membrane protein YdjX (TVP38/TMEM64 family)